MSEETKEPKEEKDKKPQAAKNKEVKEIAATEEEAPKPKVLKHARVKVTQMSLEQVERALGEVQQKMGGYHSHHAQALLGRKEVLMREQQMGKQKAA